jgi:polar amino acid transport system substrate-binding protein
MHVPTRRRALASMAAIAALSGLPATSRAAANTPSRAPLRLTMVNLMPWAGNGQGGQPVGALVDLSAQLAALSGVPITPMPVPYGRAPFMLTSGGTDLMLMIDTGAKAGVKGVAAIDHVGTVDIVVFGRSGFRFQRMADLFGKTVGTLRHSGYSPELEAESRIHKHAFDSYHQGVRMLQAGRLDVVLGVRDSIEYALGKAAGEVSPRFTLGSGRVALYADPRIDAATIAALQAACRQLRQKRVLDELLHRPQRR